MTKIHIDKAIEKGEVYPLIINFQNGETTENLQTTQCQLLQDEETGKRSIATELENIVYAGEEDNEDFGNTFVLARNRHTGKVRLIEVGCAQVRPYFHKELSTSQLIETSAIELSRKFGSKKSKQKMEQKDRLKVDTNIITEQMKNVTETMTEDKVDLSAYVVENSDDFYIPPIDRTATDPQDVYDIDKILTREQYDKIYSEMESKDYESEYHQAVKEVIADKSSSELSRKEKVLALYASYLFTMFSMSSKELAKKSIVIGSISPTLNEIVLTNFCQTGGKTRMRPAMYRDKTICHAIVFCLLIHNKVDIEKMSVSLKVTPKFAMTKTKATSATVMVSGNKKYATIKVPLPSNKPFRRRSAKF